MFQRPWMRRVALLAGAMAVSVLPACGPAKPVEAGEVVPELKLEQVRFRVWRGADLRVKGEARVATLRRDSTELRATDLVAIQPRDDGPAVIRAPRGQGFLRTRVFTADGGVTVEHGSDVGRTPSARYVPDGHLIFARAGGLFAARFDPSNAAVSGDPIAIASGVSMESAFGMLQASASGGVLVAEVAECRGSNQLLLEQPGGPAQVCREQGRDTDAGHAECAAGYAGGRYPHGG